MKYRLIVFSFLFLQFFTLKASDYGVGQWKVHLAFSKSYQVAPTNGNRVYAHSGEGLFFVDKNDQSINVISKIDGLSDVGISYIRFHKTQNTLVVAYENGNIDLIKENEITNINAILRSSVIGSKKINHIEFYKEFAYLSCDFGLVVLDLKKLEIKESMRNLGDKSEQIKVYSTAISTNLDSIFIASEHGIKSASLKPIFILQDINNWESYANQTGIKGKTISKIALLQDTLYAAIDGDHLYRKNGVVWDTLKYSYDKKPFLGFVSDNKSLYASYNNNSVKITSSNDFLEIGVGKVWANTFCQPDNEGNHWISTNTAGIAQQTASGPWTYYKPNGPTSNKKFRFKNRGSQFIVTLGGIDGFKPVYEPGFLYVYQNALWSFENQNFSALVDVDIAANGDQYYSSFGYGLKKIAVNGDVKVYNDTNSPLVNAIDWVNKWEPYCKSAGSEFDSKGNLWVSNAETRNNGCLHKLAKDGTWKSYRPNDVITGGGSDRPVDILLDKKDNVWTRMRGPGSYSGIVGFRESDEKTLYFSSLSDFSIGGASNLVNDYAIDQDDNMWIATNKGVFVIYNVSRAFDDASLVPTRPIYEGRPLLTDEVILAVAVDGGDRKWFGTQNGVFLFNDNATQNVLNFNVDNSPLLSNVVSHIGVYNFTGEVFFATDKGIVSYWNDATTGTEEHLLDENKELVIFPNPVMPDFDGVVAIQGLVRDAHVKITDLSGSLVYENKAEGGMLTWNTKNGQQELVKSGIYLVFSTDETGEETFVGKVAVVR